jgi:succinoglycan biosynthesis protein ExoL
MKAAVFGYNSREPRVIKRIRAFRDAGADVVGLCFRRRRFNADYVPEWDNIDLGEVKDRRYAHRLLVMVGAFLRLFRSRHRYRDADFLYAYNLDLTALALFARWVSRADPVVVYEIGDIQPAMTGRGAQGSLLRSLERFVLRRIDLLTVTSPAFVDQFLRPVQGYEGPWFLLENKVVPPYESPHPTVNERLELRRNRAQRGVPWRVGYFGALRCRRSWELIQQIAEAAPDHIEFRLRGYASLISEEEMRSVEERLPNVRFLGEYSSPGDLYDIYADVDLAWGFELLDPEHNSKWLLPTRLYEGGQQRVPFVASSRTEMGRAVERLDVGWTFDPPYATDLVRFFRDLDETTYCRCVRNYRDIPMSTFAGAEEYPEFLKTIRSLRKSP